MNDLQKYIIIFIVAFFIGIVFTLYEYNTNCGIQCEKYYSCMYKLSNGSYIPLQKIKINSTKYYAFNDDI